MWGSNLKQKYIFKNMFICENGNNMGLTASELLDQRHVAS